MLVTIEEEKKTFEYQETMNADVENIAIKKKNVGDQYTKLLIIHILRQQKYFNIIFRPMYKKSR